MKRIVLAMAVAAALLALLVSASGAQTRVPEPIYRFDPTLVVGSQRQTTISADPNVIVEKSEEKASLRLQTEGPITPYLEAEEGQELSEEELRLLDDRMEGDSLTDYRLEAGIGVKVEDTTSLNLGYRFHTHPSLLDERRNDPLSLSGDLRVTFDIKVPFD